VAARTGFEPTTAGDESTNELLLAMQQSAWELYAFYVSMFNYHIPIDWMSGWFSAFLQFACVGL